jgi:hypothetical protein
VFLEPAVLRDQLVHGRFDARVFQPPPKILPAVSFDDADFVRTRDAKRWRLRERNTRLGASSIAGRGSFATRLILKGEPVLVLEGARGNFPVNHSERPNTARAANRAGLFALRDISPGEEITEDYRFLPYFEQRIPDLPQTIVAATPEEYAAMIRAHRFLVRGP